MQSIESLAKTVNNNQPDELVTNVLPNPAYHTVDATQRVEADYETIAIDEEY